MNEPTEGLPPSTVQESLPDTLGGKLRRVFFGGAHDFRDPSLRHKISLIAFLAWVGLGADGLSSSAYGPDEAFRKLGDHTYLTLVLASPLPSPYSSSPIAYSRIIEHFPGAAAATSWPPSSSAARPASCPGCALLVDYILTITVSIASGGDAVFSLLPPDFSKYKLAVEFAAILFLMAMNLRGVKESVTVLIPIFLTFVATHVILIFGGILFHLAQSARRRRRGIPGLPSRRSTNWVPGGISSFSCAPIPRGAGTYTGIEAVSNGLGIMREPKSGNRQAHHGVHGHLARRSPPAACSSATCSLHVTPSKDKTMNAVLAEALRLRPSAPAALPVGTAFVLITIASEAVLLLVAAQTGFIDGPRVMANMAVDSWLPRKFAALSDRLTTQNGVLLMGIAAAATLAYTRGHTVLLVVMYSINVFVTFSLSEAGMLRFWIRHRKTQRQWKRNLAVHALGLVLCLAILCIMVFEKLTEGGWLTLTVTAGLIALCFGIRRHYRRVSDSLKEVDRTFASLPSHLSAPVHAPELDPSAPTAVLLVGGYGGLGIHMLLSLQRLFPDTFKNIVFASVGVIDSSFFQHEEGVETIGQQAKTALEQYADLARRMGKPCITSSRIGTDVVEEASTLSLEISRQFPRSVFFAGTLVFDHPHWYDRFLHNETAYAVQRRLKAVGLPLVVLPLLLRRS